MTFQACRLRFKASSERSSVLPFPEARKWFSTQVGNPSADEQALRLGLLRQWRIGSLAVVPTLLQPTDPCFLRKADMMPNTMPGSPGVRAECVLRNRPSAMTDYSAVFSRAGPFTVMLSMVSTARTLFMCPNLILPTVPFRAPVDHSRSAPMARMCSLAPLAPDISR